MQKAFCLLLEHGLESRANLASQPLAVRSAMLAQHRHPLHEELVEIGGEDGEELDTLEEGRPLVQRLGQHTPIELEPAQIPVDPDGLDRRQRQRRSVGGLHQEPRIVSRALISSVTMPAGSGA